MVLRAARTVCFEAFVTLWNCVKLSSVVLVVWIKRTARRDSLVFFASMLTKKAGVIRSQS